MAPCKYGIKPNVIYVNKADDYYQLHTNLVDVPQFITDMAQLYSIYYHRLRGMCHEHYAGIQCSLTGDHPGQWHMSTRQGQPLTWWYRKESTVNGKVS